MLFRRLLIYCHGSLFMQSLCTECGKKLSDAEMIMDRFDSISRKIPILKRQLDSLQVWGVVYGMETMWFN